MASLHPQVVHFAIALLIVGVLFRAVSLLGRPAFIGPAAATLLALGTVAIIVAALTGDAAHGPVEQMPGLRPAVMEHEAWGERARNVFIIVFKSYQGAGGITMPLVVSAATARATSSAPQRVGESPSSLIGLLLPMPRRASTAAGSSTATPAVSVPEAAIPPT